MDKVYKATNTQAESGSVVANLRIVSVAGKIMVTKVILIGAHSFEQYSTVYLDFLG